jgi:NAD-dependent SIR2 family protein deacetylase
MLDTEAIRAAAEAVDRAAAIVVTAGAGAGVDSGLPDFRGDEGFWNAYPPYRRLRRSFVSMASPDTFVTDPELAWGFYGHRRALYRATVPHRGYHVLRTWIEKAPAGGFVVTSNVDGQFQACRFDPDAIWEVHGTLHVDQCLARCGTPPFPAGADVEVDPATMRARPPLPTCPGCGALARPNVLMFGDADHDGRLGEAQLARFRRFLDHVGDAAVTIVELGAGTALPTIRRIGESLAASPTGRLVRINPREAHGPPGTIGLEAGARDALEAVAAQRGHRAG